MSAISKPGLLTVNEYSRLPDIPGFKDELIEGERVLSPSARLTHTLLVKRLVGIIEQQLENGTTVLSEAGCKLNVSSSADSLPIPDLMVVNDSDVRESNAQENWFSGKPLFVVGVISPSERLSRRMQKIGLYLEAGAGAVVEVDSARRIALVYRPDRDTAETFREDMLVDWPFKAAVSQIFDGLNRYDR